MNYRSSFSLWNVQCSTTLRSFHIKAPAFLCVAPFVCTLHERMSALGWSPRQGDVRGTCSCFVYRRQKRVSAFSLRDNWFTSSSSCTADQWSVNLHALYFSLICTVDKCLKKQRSTIKLHTRVRWFVIFVPVCARALRFYSLFMFWWREWACVVGIFGERYFTGHRLCGLV